MKKLTEAQLTELRRLYEKPQNTYGASRARVQNNLVLLRLAQYAADDGVVYPPGTVATPYGGKVVADQCVITDAGRRIIESGVAVLPDRTAVAAPRAAEAEDLGFNEVLLHVYWTTNAGGRSHLDMLSNKVSADLGLSTPPEFTREEMEQIMYAAKMAALKCVFTRKKRTG